jgi:signal transduction histidine kinase
MVLLAVSGWVIGYMLRRLAETDRYISAFRAREEVARTLHDGVLQTLAVIQRRSTDDELVALARSQEHELRDYLFGSSAVEEDLAAGLRSAARRAEQRYGIRVQVVAAPDLPNGSQETIQRITAAVGEALTNAAKHGDARSATVYAEPEGDGSVFVSVKDDGDGFDQNTVVEGEGLSRSIRGRMAEVGGRVEVDGRPGRGTEVRMWL